MLSDHYQLKLKQWNANCRISESSRNDKSWTITTNIFSTTDHNNKTQTIIFFVSIYFSVPAGITVYGKIILPSTAQELNTNSCLTIQIKEYKECTGVGCSSPTIARSTYENVQLMNRIIQYDIYLPNTSYGHFIITAVINNGWCFDGKADEWIKVGDFINDELRHFIVLPHQIDVEVDIQLNHFVALTTTSK